MVRQNTCHSGPEFPTGSPWARVNARDGLETVVDPVMAADPIFKMVVKICSELSRRLRVQRHPCARPVLMRGSRVHVQQRRHYWTLCINDPRETTGAIRHTLPT